MVRASALRDDGGLTTPERKRLRKVFLDSHLGAQLCVVGAIGDAKATMAQHGLYDVFAQLVTGRQCVAHFGCCQWRAHE